jgi:hypothetical protein
MNGRRWFWVGAITIVLGWFWKNHFKESSTERLPSAGVRQEVRGELTPLSDEWAARDAGQRSMILNDWRGLLDWLRSSPPPDSEEIAARLLELRANWSELDAHVLAEAIRYLLDSGEDAPTGLPFLVSDHGQLAGWPTLRVFLLDVLVGSDPETAADVARRVLDETPSANEYAVALRSLTHEGPGRASDRELLSKFDVLLQHDGWSSEAGFAEAFDLARFLGSTEAARRIAAWPGNSELKAMALHEFISDHPTSAADLIQSSEAESLDPATRASLMARIDPSDPVQLSAADTYLRDPALTVEEAVAFLEAFPLRSITTGHRLYGETPAPYSLEGTVAGDRAALEQVNAWMADTSLVEYRESIIALQQRLQKWVGQAGK